MKVVMSIAGFDPSSGAGVMRDIITFRKIGLYGVGAVTAVTYQNSWDVYGFKPLMPEDVVKQIDALMEDFQITHVKVGMVANNHIANLIANKIEEYNLVAVVDPILKSSSGYAFISSPEDLEDLLKKASVITPNVPEAEVLSGVKIKDEESAIKAGMILREKYGPTIIKGGHLDGVDYLFDDEIVKEEMEHLGKDIHGTGCVYSSALTAHLALGYSLKISFRLSREFLQSEIRNSTNVSKRELFP
jgi:hydroxymethylpyrimidine/phosphomethylpyrimidine kinase